MIRMIMIKIIMIKMIMIMIMMTMIMDRLPAAWATQPVWIASLDSCLGLNTRPVPVKVDQDC